MSDSTPLHRQGARVCDWCGEDATAEVEMEPAVFETQKVPVTQPDGTTIPKGFKVMKRRAIKAWVCPAHYDMVQRNRREKEEAAAAHRERLRVAREAKKARGRAA